MKHYRLGLSVIALLAVLAVSGCETAKGAAVGLGAAVGSTAQGVAKDVQGSCNFIMMADNWMKKNLW